jgi:hypothetical protein
MGEILKAFEFPEAAAKAIYPWDELFDGQIRRLKKGKDFECEPSSFGTLARSAAERKEVGIRVSVDTKQGFVVLQGYKLSAEELAELKAKKAAKKAEKEDTKDKEEAKDGEGKDEQPKKKGRKW